MPSGSLAEPVACRTIVPASALSTRCVSRRYAAARRARCRPTRPGADDRPPGRAPRRAPPTPTWLACTSQYDGSGSAIVVHAAVARDREPDAAEQARAARSSRRSRGRSSRRSAGARAGSPSAANGMQPDEDSSVISTQCRAAQADARGDARRRRAARSSTSADRVGGQQLGAGSRRAPRAASAAAAGSTRPRARRRSARRVASDGVHRAERGQPDHEVQRARDAAPAEVVLVAGSARRSA